MKKIFTLIAVALVAISVSAKEEIPVSTGDNPFKPWDNCTISGNTITMGEGYKGGAIYIGRSMMDYDYVWIKFKNATGRPNFGITYDEWISQATWGPVFAATTTEMDGTGLVGIKIDKTTVMVHGNAETGGEGIGDVYGQHVQQLTIQGQAGEASVTIEGIWFGTAAEYAADGGEVVVRPAAGGSLTMWSGELVYDGWGVSSTVDVKYFDVAEVGDKIYCTVKDAAAGDDFNPIFKYQDWSDFTELMATFGKDESHFWATIDAGALAYLKTNGLRFQGNGFTLTKVELQVPGGTGIRAITTNENVNAPMYNLSGQRVDASFKGVVIKNGKKVVIK